MSTSDGNAVLVNALSSSVRSTLNGMETAPALIRRVLEEGSWQSFTTPRGEQVEHATFESFITSPPTRGLGKTVPEIVRVVGDDDALLGELARALNVAVDDLRSASVPGVDSHDPVARDAAQFGAHTRSGGWVFGLMVARNVKPGSSGSSSDGKGTDKGTFPKVTAAKFAMMAGTGVPRVMRFYKAWERAASAGVVPGFDELAPGVAVELPEPDLWANFFITYEKNGDRRESIARQAELAGTSYAEALKVAERPSALRTAILGDAKTAETAQAALVARLQEDPFLRSSFAKTFSERPELKKVIAAESRKTERMDFVRQAAEEGKARTPAGQVIELPGPAQEKASQYLAVAANPEAAPEDVEEAYEAVQEIIIKTVGADPALRTREQRSKYRKTLMATVKGIESIDPDDLVTVVDDELRESIIAAQQRINELAELVEQTKAGRLRAI
jgi:hypothetical protein